jgi:hypothetical protein
MNVDEDPADMILREAKKAMRTEMSHSSYRPVHLFLPTSNIVKRLLASPN